MLTLEWLKESARRKVPQDLVALDIATTGLKVVRMRKAGGAITVTGCAILPPLATAEDGSRSPVILPKPLLANYAAVAFTAERSVIRVVSLPGHLEAGPQAEAPLRDHIGLDNKYRISFIPAGPTKTKNESRFFAVAIPEEDAAGCLAHVAAGAPAPYSLEVSGVAAASACLMIPVAQQSHDSLCVIDCGARISTMSIFHKGNLILARKLETGGDAVVQKVQKQLGVDAETARSIVTEGSFDVSKSVREVIEPFLRQLTISRDFAERHENCKIAATYVSGGMSLSSYWVQEIQKAIGTDVLAWDPFSGLTLPPGAYPDEWQGQQCRFAAAVGAGLGVLQEA
jgi:type IV pilus assembly protein PilM